LLVIVRDKGLFGVKFGIFNYPTKQKINPLPLFKITFEFLGTSQFHTQGCEKSFIAEEYTKWLPFQANRVYLEEAGFSLTRQLNIVFSKDQKSFLKVHFPKPTFSEEFKKQMVCTLTGSAIPEGQTWQWQSNNMRVQDDKLVDVVNNNRILMATFSPVVFFTTLEITYCVINPEMPKHLVPAFVNLSVLVGKDSS